MYHMAIVFVNDLLLFQGRLEAKTRAAAPSCDLNWTFVSDKTGVLNGSGQAGCCGGKLEFVISAAK